MVGPSFLVVCVCVCVCVCVGSPFLVQVCGEVTATESELTEYDEQQLNGSDADVLEREVMSSGCDLTHVGRDCQLTLRLAGVLARSMTHYPCWPDHPLWSHLSCCLRRLTVGHCKRLGPDDIPQTWRTDNTTDVWEMPAGNVQWKCPLDCGCLVKFGPSGWI